MSKGTENANKYQERRLKLSEISRQAKELQKELIAKAKTPQGKERIALMRVNDLILKYIYDTQGATEFKTFWQWKAEKKKVKKGSKAFVLWGRKRNKTTQDEKGDELNEYSFFPLVYLFSNIQVEPDGARTEKEESKKEFAKA